MPYLKEKDKALIDLYDFPACGTAGELNYCFTKLAQEYIIRNGESYQTYNDIAGSCMNFYQELYRRKVSGYEDKKKNENGDVY